MIYVPNQKEDNAELSEMARIYWNCREHQITPVEFDRWCKVVQEVDAWQGHKIDILAQVYFAFQNHEIEWAASSGHPREFQFALSQGWHDKRWHRAVGIFGEYAKRGLLSTEQCRIFDRIIQSKNPAYPKEARG